MPLIAAIAGSSVLAWAGLGVAALGAVVQYSASRDAEKAASNSAAEQRAQFASQQRIADIKNSRERANMARQARSARAAIANQGANAGVSASSGVSGGMASVATQTATNLGVFGAIEENQKDIIASQTSQAAYTADGSSANANMTIGGAIAGIGGSIFTQGNGFKTIFDEQKK